MQEKKEAFEGWQVTLCTADRPTKEHICVPPVVKGYARKVKTTRYAGGCLLVEATGLSPLAARPGGQLPTVQVG